MEGLEMPALAASKPTSWQRHRAIAAVPNRTLSVFAVVLDEFHRAGLSYCYWKSILRLEDALAGESDLDLLIDRAHQHRAQAILFANGFKHFPDVGGRDHPSVSSYLGYDEASGRIVHLHFYVRLVVGEPLVKNFYVPWQAAILARAIRHPSHNINILDEAGTAVLLAVRAAVELNRMDPVVLRHQASIRQKFELDRERIAATAERWLLRQKLGEILPVQLAGGIVDGIFSGRRLHVQRRLLRHMRRALAAYRTYNTIEMRLRSCGRALFWAAGNLNKCTFHAPRPWRRRAPGGGRLIALVGVDGSGKSTVKTNIATWLGEQVDTIPVYFGTGDGRPSFVLLPVKLMMPVMNRLFRTKPKGASHGRIAARGPGVLYSLLMMCWATFVALDKRVKLRAAQRAVSRGLLVVADRYPQNESPAYSDGPLLPRLRYVPPWLRRYEARAYALAQSLPPDLVLKLEVTQETVARREPEMDAAAIRSRANAVRRLEFRGARVVTVDAERPLGDVLRSVKNEIWRLL